ncbi:hypothetical protein CO641_05225 [Lysobacteraceae bacterium NML91-0213]|nr:hypothetical protein CO641_05225 [Xanthomonadaceae bacterium NML91-0213]
MSKVLLHLRNVPDEEADGVRAFLDAHRIAWYQTRPGPLGITGGAIWVKHDQDYPQARRLMDGYQQDLRERVRAGLAQARARGEHETFADMLRERPGWVLVRVVAILALLALMALPGYLLWR